MKHKLVVKTALRPRLVEVMLYQVNLVLCKTVMNTRFCCNRHYSVKALNITVSPDVTERCQCRLERLTAISAVGGNKLLLAAEEPVEINVSVDCLILLLTCFRVAYHIAAFIELRHTQLRREVERLSEAMVSIGFGYLAVNLDERLCRHIECALYGTRVVHKIGKILDGISTFVFAVEYEHYIACVGYHV